MLAKAVRLRPHGFNALLQTSRTWRALKERLHPLAGVGGNKGPLLRPGEDFYTWHQPVLMGTIGAFCVQVSRGGLWGG